MAEPLNDASISTLVDTFYARVREDDLIGPVFNRVVEDWPEHLAKLKDFWSSVVLSAGRYKGNPMMAHLPIPEMDPQHLDRWLTLWERTLSELFEPEVAEIFLGKAIMVGERFVTVASYMRGAQSSVVTQ
ncbi:MAG: group III truncated hemoglobin [Acidobacteriaceae bacterium]